MQELKSNYLCSAKELLLPHLSKTASQACPKCQWMTQAGSMSLTDLALLAFHSLHKLDIRLNMRIALMVASSHKHVSIKGSRVLAQALEKSSEA